MDVKSDDGGINGRGRHKGARRDDADAGRPGVELNGHPEDAQVARRRDHPIRHLALDHHHRARRLDRRFEDVAQDRRCDVVGQVRDDLEPGHDVPCPGRSLLIGLRLRRHPREVGGRALEDVRDDHLEVRAVAQRLFDDLGERGVDLDRDHPGRQVGQRPGQHAQARADLQHDVRGLDLRRLDDACQVSPFDQEVLA